MGRDSSEPVVIDLDSNFLWSVFTANLGYILLAAFQKFYTKAYPAARHHSDPFSITIIVIHILCGATVVFGGCAFWLAIHYWSHWNSIRIWAAHTIAVAAIGHSVSNLFLLRKIPGVRVFNVPIYIFITVYNAHRARQLLISISGSVSGLEREMLLLWCAMSTYIWVRYFIFVFWCMTGTEFPEISRIVYTLSLPYAAVPGIVVPAVQLGGVDDRWILAIVAAAPVLGPPMIGLHRVCVRTGEWPWMWRCGISRWVVQFLLDTTNPVAYHKEGKDINSSPHSSIEDCRRKKI